MENSGRTSPPGGGGGGPERVRGATLSGPTPPRGPAKADDVLDAVGLMCPVPIFMLAQRVREMQAGEVLELQADDPAAKEDVPAWCRRTGNPYLGMREEECLKFYVKVSGRTGGLQAEKDKNPYRVK